MSRKILVVTPRFPVPASGACEQDRLEGIKQLKRLGNDVQVIGKVFDFQKKDEEKVKAFSKEFGIPAHLVPYIYCQKRRGFKKIIYYAKRLLWPPYWDGSVYEYAEPLIKQKFADILKNWQPDIVWFDYTFMLPLYPLARRYGCKIITRSVIYDPNNLLEEEGDSLLNYVRAKIKTITEYRSVKQSDYVFAITPDENNLYKKLGAKNIQTLPLRALHHFLGKNTKVKDRDILNVFFLGSSYNIRHNLQAAKLVIEQIAPKANVEFPGKFNFFVTGGKLPEDLQKKCVNNIKYAGYVDDFEGFLSDMDIALIPSLSGAGMQQKIFESLVRGFPLITSARGLAGYSFDCETELLCAVNAEEFAARLGKLLDFRARQKISQAALAKSQKLFSRDKLDILIKETLAKINPSFWQGKKVFVSGHGGFIWEHLVAKLKSWGADVRWSDADLLKSKLEIKDSFYPEYIFHLAAIAPAVSDNINDGKIIEDNIAITKKVLEFAGKVKAKIILASSSHVYPPSSNLAGWKESEVEWGNAVSAYGLSKQKVEQYCSDYAGKNNLGLVIVRLANVYGPGDKSNRFIPTFIRKCLEKKLPLEVLGKSDVERDFIYVDDVITGLTEAVVMIGYKQVVNIGSGTKSTVGEIAEIIKNKTGLGAEKIIFLTLEGSGVASNILDISKSKKMIGYSPEVDLEEGLSKTVEWWKKFKMIL